MAKRAVTKESDNDEMFWSFLAGGKENNKKISKRESSFRQVDEVKQRETEDEEEEYFIKPTRQSDDKKRVISKKRRELQDALNRLDDLERLGVVESDEEDLDPSFEEEYEYRRDNRMARGRRSHRKHETKKEKNTPNRPESRAEEWTMPEMNPDTWLLDIFGDYLPVVTKGLGVVTAGVGLSALGLGVKVLYDALALVIHRRPL